MPDAHGDQKKALNPFPRTRVGRCHVGAENELNLGPLEEHLELLTAEPSLQSQISHILIIN